MTHAQFWNAIPIDKEKIKEEIAKDPVDLKNVQFLVDEIANSTLAISKTEISQIVIETFKLFKECLFTNIDFRFGWTYPKLLFNKSEELIIITSTPQFMKEDVSFMTDEDVEYFAKDKSWKQERREQFMEAKRNLENFLGISTKEYIENIENYTTETLCAMIVSLRFFKIFELHDPIMTELAKRRNNGDDFEYEEYIKKEWTALPKATLNFDLMQQAFQKLK